MSERKQSSVAKKLIRILVVLGIITGLMCFLNLLAYNTLGRYNSSLQETISELNPVVSGEDTELTTKVDAILQHIDIKIKGTYIFNIVLLVNAINYNNCGN